MCGIAGQYCFGGGVPDERLLKMMSDRLAHRGPDGEGSRICGPTGLVHRRLAIIDLSEDGLEPMTNEDGTLWLLFNGEIYNYLELRDELVKKGHVFHSHSDTEVILHAYEEWKTGCVQKFNGMWAFALWDERQQRLFCSRDRLGIKPFYYAVADGSFLFASEIKALLAHPAVGTVPDDRKLATYLEWGVYDHSGETMFEGVHQLRPARWITVTADGPQEPFQYWDLLVNPAVSAGISDQKIASGLLDTLRSATRIHLRSDVPTGTCLSGGLDSSTLTVLINGFIREEYVASVGERQKTFSAVFTDRRFDESRYVEEIVQATGVDGHTVEPRPSMLLQDLDRLVYMQDEPFGSLSIYAQYCVIRMAKASVKVVFDGQGADEMLGGYLAYQGSYIGGLFRTFRWLTAAREAIGSLRYHGGFFRSALRQLATRKKRRNLLRVKGDTIYRYRGSLDEILYRELTSTNLTSILHYEDRNSMAFSIELRVPFLDVRLVEYIAALPLNQKIRGGITKFSLRNAIRGIVPEPVRCRMDKMGFVTPEEVWMKEDLREFMLGLLGSESFRSRKYWDADAVIANYSSFLAGKSEYSPEIWRIACTELWLRKFFDERASLP